MGGHPVLERSSTEVRPTGKKSTTGARVQRRKKSAFGTDARPPNEGEGEWRSGRQDSVSNWP